MKKIKLGLVDDHGLFRNGLRTILELRGEVETIWEASNGEIMIEKLSLVGKPDVVIMDINMPVMNGFQAVEWLRTKELHIPVVVLTMYANEESILHMVKLGVKAFLTKDTDPNVLMEAIKKAADNEIYYPEYVTQVIIQQYSSPTNLPKLTEKEIAFIKLSASEMTYKEIAEAMQISPRSAEAYRDTLFQKLNIKSRAGLVLYAIKHKLFNLDEFES